MERKRTLKQAEHLEVGWFTQKPMKHFCRLFKPTLYPQGEIRMFLFQPRNDFFSQFINKGDEFLYIFFGNGTDVIILRYVSFIAARIKIFGICFTMATQDQRQCLNSTVMLQGFFRTKAFRIKQDGTEFQCSIVGNPKTPVSRNISGGISQITVNDLEKIRYSLLARLMGTQPAVFKPFLQCHLRIQ